VKRRWIAIVIAAGIVALPSLAGATSQLTATNVRVVDHPAYVAVLISFNSTISVRHVTADSLTKIAAALHLAHRGVTTQTTGRRGDGVRVSLQPATQGLNISVDFAWRRFKYVSYWRDPKSRLGIDLWKRAPKPYIRTQSCQGGLTLDLPQHTKPGVIHASGSERGIYENQFRLVVRNSRGKIIGQRHVHGQGSWSATVKYHASYGQWGVVEAVAFSPKDAAVACLAQQSVTLPASCPTHGRCERG
jgi:hypothetical protein